MTGAEPARSGTGPIPQRGAIIMKSMMNGLSVLVLGLWLASPADGQTVLKTSSLRLEIGPRGEIVKLLDLKGGKDYVPEGRPGWLGRVRNGISMFMSSNIFLNLGTMNMMIRVRMPPATVRTAAG